MAAAKKSFDCCIECEKRHVGCHARCEDYLTLKAKYDEESRKRYEASLEKVNYNHYLSSVMKRHKKGK